MPLSYVLNLFEWELDARNFVALSKISPSNVVKVAKPVCNYENLLRLRFIIIFYFEDGGRRDG